ncbi:MAG: hypothetical protein R3C14_19975 [Caldilineaceae bacterium]
MNIQRVLPVFTSVIIILIVALLRDRSRTLAAILATMPLNMVLGLWIIATSASATSQNMLAFVRSLLIGQIPTYIWLVVLYLALRSGWRLIPAVLAGYAAWGLLLILAMRLGILSLNR